MRQSAHNIRPSLIPIFDLSLFVQPDYNHLDPCICNTPIRIPTLRIHLEQNTNPPLDHPQSVQLNHQRTLPIEAHKLEDLTYQVFTQSQDGRYQRTF
jgi:hypothetical protein